MSRTNLDNAVLSITRIGTFSEGEKEALTKAFRTAGFPGNWLLTNPTNGEVLRYDGVNWVNSAGGAVEFIDLTDTPSFITPNAYIKAGAGGTDFGYTTDVAEKSAAATISGAWNFTTWPTINGYDILNNNSSIVTLADVNASASSGASTGDVLAWSGTDWNHSTLTFDTYNPMTTNGDIIYGGASGTGTRLGIGSASQVLTVVGGVPSWQTPASGFADPMTTRGDLIYRDATNTTARLAHGTAGQYLYTDGTDVSWNSPAFDDTSPMTTNEDIIKQSGGTATRLAVGTNGQVLTVTAGVVGWATPASGFADPMTTRGDIIYRDATNTTNRLGVGTSGQVLTSDGTDISWATPSSGVSTFVALSDTPSSYTSQALKWLRVNATANALEFVTSPVTSVGGTSPIASSGGTSPTISIQAATAAQHGYMSSTYASKLDGIEAGANVTDAANVAAAGAIMDSNYSVDGFQVRLTSTSYTTRTFSATSPVNITNGDGQAGAPVISIDAATTTNSGAVELATSIETNTGTDGTRAVTPAGLTAWTGSTALNTFASSFTVSGTISAGTFNATSARDKKRQVAHYIDFDRIRSLHPISYKLIEDPDAPMQIGYFADEVAHIFPEVVAFEDEKPVGIDYSRLVVPAIEKIKQQQTLIEDLYERLDGIEGRLRALEYDAGVRL